MVNPLSVLTLFFIRLALYGKEIKTEAQNSANPAASSTKKETILSFLVDYAPLLLHRYYQRQRRDPDTVARKSKAASARWQNRLAVFLSKFTPGM